MDTNVAMVANGQCAQAGPPCIDACITALERIIAQGILVVDDRGLILDEYMKHLSLSGQPGAGDAFLKWVWNVQATDRVVKTPLTPKDGDGSEFAEFPETPALAGFDRSDRKYVAVALRSGRNPQVLNAVDSDWWNYRKPLEDQGVKVVFLCPEQFPD